MIVHLMTHNSKAVVMLKQLMEAEPRCLPTKFGVWLGLQGSLEFELCYGQGT